MKLILCVLGNKQHTARICYSLHYNAVYFVCIETARFCYSLNSTRNFSKLCYKDIFLFVFIYKTADFLPLSVSF